MRHISRPLHQGASGLALVRAPMGAAYLPHPTGMKNPRRRLRYTRHRSGRSHAHLAPEEAAIGVGCPRAGADASGPAAAPQGAT